MAFGYTPWIEYLSEITHESGNREYESKCGLKSASVTTVLSKYEDKTSLDTWKKKKNDEGIDPNQISSESARVGTATHTLIENYLEHGVYPNVEGVEQELASNAIESFYKHINHDYVSVEQPVFYNGLIHPTKPEDFRIAGRYDQLLKIDDSVFQIKKTGELLNKQFLICDLKTKRSYESLKNGKRKLKALPRTDKCDFIFKNCLQAAIYSATLSLQTNFKDLYGVGVEGAVLVYVNEEKSRLMYLSRNDLNYYWRLVKEILRDFYDIEPLQKTWQQMIEESNWRCDYETGNYISNVPKEIILADGNWYKG